MQSRWQTWVDLITPQPGSSVTTAGITGSPCWRACQMKDAAWCRSSSGPLPSLFSCPKQSHTQRRPLETPAPVFDWSLIESAMATGGNILQPFVGGGLQTTWAWRCQCCSACHICGCIIHTSLVFIYVSESIDAIQRRKMATHSPSWRRFISICQSGLVLCRGMQELETWEGWVIHFVWQNASIWH